MKFKEKISITLKSARLSVAEKISKIYRPLKNVRPIFILFLIISICFLILNDPIIGLIFIFISIFFYVMPWLIKRYIHGFIIRFKKELDKMD